MPSSVARLLLEKKLVAEKKIKEAQSLSEKHSDKIEKVLLKNEMISGEKLYRTVAERYDSQYVDIKKYVCDYELMEKEDMFLYLKYDFVPWRRLGKLLSIAVVEMNDELFLHLKSKYPDGFRIVYTNPRGILVNIQRRFSDSALSMTKKELALINPKASSEKVLQGRQKAWVLFMVLVLLYSFLSYPDESIQIVFVMANILFFLNMLFKAFIFCKGKSEKGVFVKGLPQKNLPLYSIIIPLYKEGKVLEGLFGAIRNLNYPKSKLDVIMAVEQFDRETISFLKKANKGGLFRVICVPRGYPQTKPKACSYALKFVKGEFVTIYDAEDRPERNQLLKAVKMFKSHDESLACVQASLRCINFKESLLSFLFSIEYLVWFGFFLKGLEKIGSPIPLGGTSNHFRVNVLRRIGGWDPYNVTEDADLGYRLFKSGYKVKIFDSVTREELPATLMSWFKQRSRWIKGHMQTYIVHLRDRSRFRKEAGISGPIGFHAFIIMPIICYFLQSFALFSFVFKKEMFSVYTIQFGIFNLVAWILMSVSFGVIAIRARGVEKRDILKVSFFPFYYLLHSISAIIALYELIFKTHYWSKTHHGFDQRREKLRREKHEMDRC